MKFVFSVLFSMLLFSMISGLFFGCGHPEEDKPMTKEKQVADSVQSMMLAIARNVSLQGPAAWVRYFERCPRFMMASGGQLAFSSFDSATQFIRHNLVKNIRKISLRWKDIRVDPLRENLAAVGAVFHEDITGAGGVTTPYDGYFTAVAECAGMGWQLRNLHWSMLPAGGNGSP